MERKSFEDVASKECEECREVKLLKNFRVLEDTGLRSKICNECEGGAEPEGEVVSVMKAVSDEAEIKDGETMGIEEDFKKQVEPVKVEVSHELPIGPERAESIFKEQLKEYILKNGAGFTVKELNQYCWVDWKTHTIYSVMDQIVEEGFMRKVKQGRIIKFYLDDKGFDILNIPPEDRPEKPEKMQLKIKVDTSGVEKELDKIQGQLEEGTFSKEDPYISNCPGTLYSEVPKEKIIKTTPGATGKFIGHNIIRQSIETLLELHNQDINFGNRRILQIVLLMMGKVEAIQIVGKRVDLELYCENDIIKVLDELPRELKNRATVEIKSEVHLLAIPTPRESYTIILSIQVDDE